MTAVGARLRHWWQVFWGLAFIEGLFGLIWLLSAPSEAEEAAWLGLSPRRLAVGSVFLILLGGIAGLLLWSWQRREHFERRLQIWFEHLIGSPVAARNLARGKLALAVGFGFGMQVLLMTPTIQEPFSRAYLERLLPLIAWGGALCLQGLLLLIRLRPLVAQSPEKAEIAGLPARPLLAFLSFFSLVWLGWSWARSALLPSENLRVGWNRQGVPILETQLALTWLIGLVILIVDRRFTKYAPQRPRRPMPAFLRTLLSHPDALIALGLWLTTAFIWQSTPLSPNWFISESRPPNQEIYPNSDALRYDASAQNALDGLGFRFFESPYVRRPLLSAYLTVLHLLRGQGYREVVSLQVTILALLPALIFLLTRQLAGRAASIMATLLIMLRETNSIAAANRITSSNAKLLMADLPTALVVSVFALIALVWLRRLTAVETVAEKDNPLSILLFALAAGGVLGACMLIRLETAVFGLVGLATLALQKWSVSGKASPLKSRRISAWLQAGLFTMGVILVISPWMVRNYRLTGQIYIDSPNFGLLLLAQRYYPFPTAVPVGRDETPPAPPPTSAKPPEPSAAETPVPESSPVQERPPIGQAAEEALEFIQSNPAALMRSFIAHTLNSEIQTVLTLPTAVRVFDSTIGFLGHRSAERLWQECCTIESYIRRLPYWHKWNGAFPLEAVLPLAVNLLLISTGLAVSWRKQRWNGLLLFSLMNSYIFLNGAFRNSGGRYLLPVDWVIPVYFSIGLAAVSRRLLGLIGALAGLYAREQNKKISAGTWQQGAREKRFAFTLVLAALGLLALGSSIPLLESAFPERHTDQRKAELLNALLNSEQLQPEQRRVLQDFLESGGMLLSGRALYPRYFSPGLDEAGSHFMFGPPELSRLSFYLSGPVSGVLWIPTANKVNYFPNSSEVLVFVCSVIPLGTLDPQTRTERVLSIIPGIVNNTVRVLAVGLFDTQGKPQALFFRSDLPTNPDRSAYCPLP